MKALFLDKLNSIGVIRDMDDPIRREFKYCIPLRFNDDYLLDDGIFIDKTGEKRTGKLANIDVTKPDKMFYDIASDKWYPVFIPKDGWTPETFLYALLRSSETETFQKAFLELTE